MNYTYRIRLMYIHVPNYHAYMDPFTLAALSASEMEWAGNHRCKGRERKRKRARCRKYAAKRTWPVHRVLRLHGAPGTSRNTAPPLSSLLLSSPVYPTGRVSRPRSSSIVAFSLDECCPTFQPCPRGGPQPQRATSTIVPASWLSWHVKRSSFECTVASARGERANSAESSVASDGCDRVLRKKKRLENERARDLVLVRPSQPPCVVQFAKSQSNIYCHVICLS